MLTAVSEAEPAVTGLPASYVPMKCTCFLALALLSLTACTPQQQNPDEIRKRTADATSTAAKDAKAVAQGVVDGLKKQKGPVNINQASDSDLKTLPGIDQDGAQRIIEGRPYDDSSDLVKKHIVSKAEYDRIADKITAK
jgi:DNA uptake protein ComE-like DNA-binding protein